MQEKIVVCISSFSASAFLFMSYLFFKRAKDPNFYRCFDYSEISRKSDIHYGITFIVSGVIALVLAIYEIFF